MRIGNNTPGSFTENVINGMRKEVEEIVKCGESVEEVNSGKWNDTTEYRDSDDRADRPVRG